MSTQPLHKTIVRRRWGCDQVFLESLEKEGLIADELGERYCPGAGCTKGE